MQDPQPKTTLADLVTAALAQPGVTDEVHLASSLDREPQRVCPESRVHDREATCSDDGGLAQSLRSPELRAHKQASDTARSPARCRGVRQPWQKPASARPIRLPPHLTLAEASSVGLVQSRTAKIPTASVLESSAVRQKRLCRRGPSTPHRRDREEACSPALHEAKHERQAGESAADGFPRHRKPFQSGPVKPVTPEPRMPRSKKLQVESDYTQATESWIARIPSDDTLQERRQQRNRIVVANRITSRETIRAAFKGKSLLEERWIGNLDDSAADTELSVPSVIAWLRRTDLYANTALTHVEVLNFVQQILAGREVNAVCNVAGRRGRTVSAIQFQAIIHWIAKHKGISYSECITKLVHHPNERTRLEHYFEEFAHASSHGFMTVYEFTRFCRAFGLFQLRPGRFVEGDVQFLFDLGDEGKAVDLEGFRRVLEKVADRLDLPAQELLHFLGEKDAERVFREGMDSAGLRRKAVVAK